MPRTKSESSYKKIYRIWFDYLRASEDYKKYCSLMRKRKASPNWQLSQKSRFQTKIVHVIGYSHFGDIFRPTFDKWWEKKKSFLLSRSPKRSVVNFMKMMEEEMEAAIQEFKFAEGRDPSLEEFKHYFIERLAPHKMAILKVTFRNYQTVEDLTLQFRKIIGQLKPQRNAKGSQHWDWEWQRPTTRKRMEEIQRYLDVYKLHLTGYPWSEMAKRIKFYSEHASAPREINRMMQSDTRKAEAILRNVEKGIFPGKY